jgi:hypothetical protein
MEAIRRMLHVPPPAATSIPFAAVREIGACVRLDIDGETSPATRTERWLRDRIVRRIPGGGGAEMDAGGRT